MEALSLQFPGWYLILCVALGVMFAVFLYVRDSTFRDHPSWLRWVMRVLRFLTVTTLSMLLLSPFLKVTHETIQQPVIVIGQDNSASLADAMTPEDSAAYVESFRQMVRALRENYDVRVMTFGETAMVRDTFTFDEKVTDISHFLRYTHDQFADQNLGAIILATDGLYNKGRNPLYSERRTSAPLYAIALGDTTVKTDLLISRVLHNRIAFLGDKFPVQVDISADRLAGRNATLRIERIEGNQRIRIEERPVRIDDDKYFQTEEILLEAVQPGVARYRASVTGIGGEALYANNSKDFYVEIIDGRVRILILANAPHPDIAAIRTVLQEHQNYTVEMALFGDFKGRIDDYDLVILHQLPTNRYDLQPLIAALDAAQKPRFFIVGNQTLLSRFNAVQPYLEIQAGQQAVNEVTAVVDKGFNLFTVPDDLNAQISTFAPLQAPFGQYTIDPSAKVYLWQRVGKVETQYPLLLFGETSGVKTGILAAEGFWRWRLHDFMQHGTHELTHALLSKTVQFLTIKEDKRRFRAAPESNLFQDNETIEFDAELYNRSYELVNDPDVFLDVRDADGNSYHYTFSKTQNSYTLALGKYPVGEYHYTAFADYDGMRHQVNGTFSVQQTELESYVTTADHRLLQALTQDYGGQVYYPAALSALADTLLRNDRIKPVMFQSVTNQPLIHIRPIFFLFLLLLGLEWFIRRYLGGY